MLIVEKLALFQRLLNGILEVLQRVLVPLAEGHVLGVEAALQKKIGERLQKVLGANPEVFAGVFRILDFHRRVSACIGG
jgi:hypothetical protein